MLNPSSRRAPLSHALFYCKRIAGRECIPDLWIGLIQGQPTPQLFEQVLGQCDDFAVVTLWLEPIPEEDEDDDRDSERTAKERYRDRMERYRR
jgi:hypothetical protein